MIRRQQLAGVLFLFFLFFSLIITNPTQIVLGDESEETDSFTQMPNYRWENQTTTDSDVLEKLDGNYYSVDNVNLHPEDTAPYSKSRELNTRDLYFDSRFMVETGGNETEYFRDILGDACDFSEDTEGFTGSSIAVSNGLAEFICALDNVGINKIIPDQSIELLKKVVVRGKSSLDGVGMTIWLYNDAHDIVSAKNLYWTENWVVYEYTFSNYQENTYGNYIALAPHSSNDNYPFNIWVDYIEIINDLDYATHVEDEIEDTWDWEDSDEYFYTEESNISDFNDGTTENYIASTPEDTKIEVVDGWLCTESNKTDTSYHVKVESLSIDSSVYRWFTAEVYIPSDSAYNLTAFYIYDADSNPLTGTTEDINNGTYSLISIDLGLDGDWSGTETKLLMKPIFYGNGGVGTENKINYNFTFLYDCELGDRELYVATNGRGSYVNPNGYFVPLPTNNQYNVIAGDATTTMIISPDVFSQIKVNFYLGEVMNYHFQSKYNLDPSYDSSPTYEGVVGWNEITLSCYDLFEHWDEFESGYIRIWFEDTDLSYLEGTELIMLDYMLLTGEFSDSSEYKFSLLNNQDEEGLSIGFNRYNIDYNGYYLNISIFDSTGIAKTFSQSFNYSYESDGWLFIDFEFDLDKKEMKFLLEYENGTDILKTRQFTDLFPNIGTQQLLLFKFGFPQICLNASADPLERIWVLIDYIDASFSTLEWRQPSETHTSTAYTFSNIFSQDVYDFDAVSPYGMAVYNQDTGASKEQWYMLDVDRFDGISFDISITGRNLDIDDNGFFHFEAFNVHQNGTLEWVFTLIWNSVTAGAGGGGYSYIYVWLQKDNNLRNLGFTTDTQYFESSMSFYYESPEKVVLQTKFDTNETELDSNQMTFEPIDSDNLFTKEWVFYHSFSVENTNSGYTNDEISIKLGGYDVTRKDILGDIVGMVLDPLISVLSFIFAPVFLLLQFLGFVISRGFKVVVDLLTPIIASVQTGLSVVLGALEVALLGAFSALTIAIDGLLDTLTSALGGLIEAVTSAIDGLWTAFLGIVDDFINTLLGLAQEGAELLFAILEFLFILLLEAVELIIDLICAGLIFIWDLFGLPDLGPLITQLITMFFDVITGIPQLITDIAEWIFFFGTFGLVLWWVWCVLLPIASLNPGEAMGQIMDRFFTGIFPWDILGIHFYIPQGLVMIGLTYFLIIAPTGSGFAIW